MNGTLTTTEENLIKDILRAIGQDDNLNKDFARALGMAEPKFNEISDLVFTKLGNGRLTVIE